MEVSRVYIIPESGQSAPYQKEFYERGNLAICFPPKLKLFNIEQQTQMDL
jgi:hypothetical protein